MEYHRRNWDKRNFGRKSRKDMRSETEYAMPAKDSGTSGTATRFESLTIASVLTQTKGNWVWTSQTINGQQVYTCLTVTISDLCCCLGGGQRRRRCIQPGSTPECSLSELQVFQKWAESASFHFILNASRADISGVKSQHHTVCCSKKANFLMIFDDLRW